MMSMGKGALVNIARKHKLNTGSSTEAELVSIADILGMMMWCKYFMEAQGYAIENNILYQDNNSTILLANNGKISDGKNIKHIKNRFFFITYKVAMGDIEIQHKGTDEMWADVNTKPTQGKRFRVMCGHVMGIPEYYNGDVDRRRTHTLLLLKIESEQLLAIDDEFLEKDAIVVPKKLTAKTTKKIMNVLFPARAMPAEKLLSVLGEVRYSPGVGPAWKTGSARFPVFYKTLVNEPYSGVLLGLCKVSRSRFCKQGGLARSREGSRVFSSNRDRSICP